MYNRTCLACGCEFNTDTKSGYVCCPDCFSMIKSISPKNYIKPAMTKIFELYPDASSRIDRHLLEAWIREIIDAQVLLSWLFKSAPYCFNRNVVRLAATRYFYLKINENCQYDHRHEIKRIYYKDRQKLTAAITSELEQINRAMNGNIVEVRRIARDGDNLRIIEKIFMNLPHEYDHAQEVEDNIKYLTILLGEDHPLLTIIKEYEPIPQHTTNTLIQQLTSEESLQSNQAAKEVAATTDSWQLQNLSPTSFTPVIPASQRDITDIHSSSYLNHAWKEIARRRRGLPDNWVCEINFPVLNAAGFVSFTAGEKEGSFIAEITNNDGTVFAMTLSKHNKGAYQGELGLLATTIMTAIVDMVCYTDESPSSWDGGPGGGLRYHSQAALKRIPAIKVNRVRRCYPIKRRKIVASTVQKKQDNGGGVQKATFIPWHYMRLQPGFHASPKAIMNAWVIARIEKEDIPAGSTFVKPHWYGKGERDEKMVVATHLCESFVMTITKLLNPYITTVE